ncbi:MAG TPA: hypothetical protein VFL04_03350, partial [Rectinemataceae bacterium]|nr:hypothetical protein [Rectinemataceae bacterium]
MNDSIFMPSPPQNERSLGYALGSPERARLEAELERLLSAGTEIPCLIGGKELRTGRTRPIIRPDERQTELGLYHLAGAPEARAAIEAALEAKRGWEAMPWEERAA